MASLNLLAVALRLFAAQNILLVVLQLRDHFSGGAVDEVGNSPHVQGASTYVGLHFVADAEHAVRILWVPLKVHNLGDT